MLLPILVSLLAASCAATSQNAQKQAAPTPDAVNRQQSTVIARTGAAGTPGQVQVKMIRDGKEIDLTGDDVIEVQGMELDDLDVDAIVNDADIQARIAEAMANVRAVMPQVNGAIAGMGMSGANWAAVEGMPFEVEMEKDAAFFGVGTEPVSPQTAAQLPLVRGTGLVVTMVEPDSPAAKAGIAPLDVIARLGDQIVVNADQFAVLVRSHKPGDAVEVTYLRGGKEQKATVTLVGKELPKLGPGGRRMGTSPLAEPAPLGSLDALDEDVLFVAPNAPGNGPRPRVMTFRSGDGSGDDFNVRVNRARKGGRAGAASSSATSTTEIRNMAFTDDEARIEWTQGGDAPSFTVTDLKGGKGWSGTGKPDDAALATLRPEVAASVRRFLENEVRMRDAIPAVPVPPVPPAPPAPPARSAPPAVSATGT